MADESKQFVGPSDNSDEQPSKVPEQPAPVLNPVIDPSVTMDVFDSLLAGNDEIVIPKIPEQSKDLQAQPELPKDDKPKEEPKVVEPKVDQVEPKEDKPKPEPRDYSGIDESLVPVFKKMGNEFFNNLAPIAKENKRIKAEYDAKVAEADKYKKNAMPDSYFSHPRGYTLTPDFEIAANTAIKAEQIVNHWNEQLNKVKAGDDTYSSLIINQQTGELETIDNVRADKDTENKLHNIISGSERQLAVVRNNLTTLATSHNTKYNEALKEVADFEKSSFSYMEGENKDKLEPIIRDTITKIIPPVFQDSPLARPYVKAIFTIQQLGAKLKALEAAQTKPDKKVEESKSKLNPNLSDMSGGGSSDSKQSVAPIEELEEILGKPW